MFKNEMKTLDRMHSLVRYDLDRVMQGTVAAGFDLAVAHEDLANVEAFELELNDIDESFNDMVRAERQIAKGLDRFDRVLNLIIAARRKLGDFAVTQ